MGQNPYKGRYVVWSECNRIGETHLYLLCINTDRVLVKTLNLNFVNVVIEN